MKTILFLEDDPDQADTISKQLRREFPSCRIIECVSESELREKVGAIAPGDIFFAVFDAMVPWALPAEDMPFPPRDVQREGMRYAGRRCLRFLRDKFGESVPVWIYSVLTRELAGIEHARNTYFLEKEPRNGELLRLIKETLTASGDMPKATD